jgi:hypothetical protein
MQDQKVLFRLMIATCCVLVVVGVLSELFSDDPKPVPQQNVLTQMAIDAGYDIGGMPQYDAPTGRWVMLVVVPQCKTKAQIGGNPGPESQTPSTFDVIAIGGSRFPSALPHLRADELKAKPEYRESLNCE